MQTTAKIVSVFLILLIFQSFVGIDPKKEFNNYELKQHEVINFNHGPNEDVVSYSAKFIRGAFDLSKYSIDLDKEGNLKVAELNGCIGKHQNEIALYHCSGSIFRNDDTLKIQAKTKYKKIYLFNLKQNGIVDSFTSNVNINVLSLTLKNNYCPNLVSTFDGVNITALPTAIKTKEIYKAKHKDNTIGIFSYFAVSDSTRKSKIYPAGDYVIIGGNTLTVSND